MLLRNAGAMLNVSIAVGDASREHSLIRCVKVHWFYCRFIRSSLHKCEAMAWKIANKTRSVMITILVWTDIRPDIEYCLPLLIK